MKFLQQLFNCVYLFAFAAAFNDITAIEDQIGLQLLCFPDKLPDKVRTGILFNVNVRNKNNAQVSQPAVFSGNIYLITRNPDGIQVNNAACNN